MGSGRKNSGFTLAEMSLVILVVALLTSIVLIANALIRQHKIRMVVTQLEQYNTAINNFELNYNALPGDIANAEEFGLGTSGGPGRNGNGDSFLSSDTTYYENINFWFHLHGAGYVLGYFDGLSSTYGKGAPYTSLSTVGIWVGKFGQDNLFSLGLDPTPGIYHMKPTDAWEVDVKMDDGQPNSGFVYAPPFSGFVGTCYDSTENTGVYNLDITSANVCALYIRMFK